MKLRRQLTALEPDKIERQRDLMVSLYKLFAHGPAAYPETLACLNEAIVIMERLSALESANAGWRDDLQLLRDEREALNEP